MISGAAGLGKPGVSGANRFGPMTTNTVCKLDPEELGLARPGIAPGDSALGGDELNKAAETARPAGRSVSARRELQRHLLARGMTAFLPKRIAEILADPIFHKDRQTTGGWRGLKWREHVDIQMVDLDALGQEAGSRLMYGAFKQALETSHQRYLLPATYTNLLADIFMSDRPMTVLWHMLGSEYDPYASKGVLKPAVANLVDLVEGAELLTLLNEGPQWRVRVGDLLSGGVATSFSPAVNDALNYLNAMDPVPSLSKFLNTAVKAFRGELDEPDSDDKGRGLGDVSIPDTTIPSRIRF